MHQVIRSHSTIKKTKIEWALKALTAGKWNVLSPFSPTLFSAIQRVSSIKTFQFQLVVTNSLYLNRLFIIYNNFNKTKTKTENSYLAQQAISYATEKQQSVGKLLLSKPPSKKRKGKTCSSTYVVEKVFSETVTPRDRAVMV